MRCILFAVAMVFAGASYACSPGNLTFDVKFPVDSETLSREEILRLLAWRTDQRKRYPNTGDFMIRVFYSNEIGVTERRARVRLGHLVTLLKNVGIHEVDLRETEIVPQSFEPRTLQDPYLLPKVKEHVNTATIYLNPRCPHPCCPGPTPR